MGKKSLIMENIERLGERYIYNKDYLGCWSHERLRSNWWEALKFFFSHSFMRGRRDELSWRYYSFTIEVLKNSFSITEDDLDCSFKRLKGQREHFNKGCILRFKNANKIGRGNSINHPDFKANVAENNPIVKLLITQRDVEVESDVNYTKIISLGNEADLMMVLDVLKFVTSEDNRKNIYNYLNHKITDDGVKAVYDELNEIRAISDKISTFIIRDLLLMNTKIKIGEDDYRMAFPIDTWVIKIARKLGCDNANIEDIKAYFIEKCRDSGIDPLKFAAGIWFLGVNSLEILLENCLAELKI